MKTIILTVLALTAILVLMAQEVQITTPRGNVTLRVEGILPDGTTTTGKILKEVYAKLDKIDNLIKGKLNRSEQRSFDTIMDEILTLLEMIPVDQPVLLAVKPVLQQQDPVLTITPTPGINITITPPPEQVNVTPPQVEQKPPTPEKPRTDLKVTRPLITDPDFSDLLSRIKNQKFSDDKIRMLKTAADSFRFKVDQIVQLIKAFQFSDDQLEALRIAWLECADPQNKYRILDAFTYSSDKTKAEQIMK
ncbi:MAG: DUF4476 domain-containing protein [Candidatus Cloacimonetes bacterium]|nr:DUF4476 domain-containing protein [Candidatus Cloacimonadota bacterium]